MGNKLPSVTPPLDYYMHDLNGYVPQDVLCNGRFLQTIKCLSDEGGSVLVKIYIKRPPYTDLKAQIAQLAEIKANFELIRNRNVFPFQKFFETEKAGYMIRQHFYSNITERLGTRPFLSHIEKVWITFQLLNALRQSSFQGISHGDIKCENVLVTSWNWVYLSDWAFYKPDYIAEDDPAEFSFFFDTSGRRTCYIAPERFYSKVKPADNEYKSAEDIFSLGCVIAELFLDGVPIFDLSQLLSFRKGEYDPTPIIKRIKDTHIQNLILHMIQRDPNARSSGEHYIKEWTGKAFPPYFPILHRYIADLMSKDVETRVRIIKTDLQVLLEVFGNERRIKELDELPSRSGSSAPQSVPERMVVDEVSLADQKELAEFAKSLPHDAASLLVNTQKFFQKFESGGPQTSLTSSSSSTSTTDGVASSSTLEPYLTSTINVKHLHRIVGGVASEVDSTSGASINGKGTTDSPSSSTSTPLGQTEDAQGTSKLREGLVILFSLLTSGIISLESTSSKVNTLDLFVEFAKYLDDECRLQRVIPYIVGAFLNDSAALVRATAVNNLTKVLEMVKHFPPSESNIFPEYILPALSPLCNDTEELVRQAFAANLAQLAEIAGRFLETSQFFKQTEMRISEDLIPHQGNYDKELSSIQDVFYNIIVDMFTKDSSSVVKRTLLTDITRFCIFFGRQKTNDFLLPLIITFLNDRDRQLRSAFFHNIVGISAFVGMTSLELFIYPCIQQALSDEEEFVIDKAINSLACLCELGLFRKQVLIEIANKLAPLLFHPNIWIRYGVVSTIAAVAKQLQANPASIYCFLVPILKPYLFADIVEVNEQNLLQCLKPPIRRIHFDAAIAASAECLQEHREITENESKKRPPTLAGVTYQKEPPQLASNSDANSLTARFMQKIEALDIVEEEKSKLVLISQYLLGAARTLRPGAHSSFHDTTPLGDEVSTASQSLPVHIVSLPIPENGVVFSLVEAGGRDKSDKTSNVTATAGGNVIGAGISGNMTSPVSPRSVDPRGGSGGLPSSSSFSQLDAGMVDLGLIQRRVVDGIAVPVEGLTLRNWKPKGLLVANLHEHAAAVNEIQVSADNQFFASCSDDGSVKVWDCQRLEKNVTNRSRLTYATQGGKITCITMCENSHSIASGSSNGTIHVFRVEFGAPKKEITTYKGTQTVFTLDKQNDGAIVGIEHFNSLDASQSLLVYATTKGKIHAWDLRCKKEAWSMYNPANAGLIHSFMVDPMRNWLIVGTGRGFYTCWDIRFNLPVKTWRQPDGSPIHCLRYFPSREGSSICAAAGPNSVYVWDVETSFPRILCRAIGDEVSSFAHSTPSPPPPPLKPIPLDSKPHHDFGSIDAKAMSSLNTGDLSSELPVVRTVLVSPDASYLISGGTDRKVRYWDIINPPSSFIISGTDKSSVASGVASSLTASGSLTPMGIPGVSSAPTVTSTKPRYLCHSEGGSNIIEEVPPSYLSSSYYSSMTGGSHHHHPEQPASSLTISQSSSATSTSNLAGGAGGLQMSGIESRRPPLPSVQHTDCILDMKTLELPHQMLITSSRDGTVKVWK